MGVILDSSILIEAERQRLTVAQLLRKVVERIGAQDAALSCISVAELAHGVHRANTSERREARRKFLDDLKAAFVSPLPRKPRSWSARFRRRSPRGESSFRLTTC